MRCLSGQAVAKEPDTDELRRIDAGQPSDVSTVQKCKMTKAWVIACHGALTKFFSCIHEHV